MIEGGVCALQVFVAGATGRLGARVVKMLLEKSPQLKVSPRSRPSGFGSPCTMLMRVLVPCHLSSQHRTRPHEGKVTMGGCITVHAGPDAAEHEVF